MKISAILFLFLQLTTKAQISELAYKKTKIYIDSSFKKYKKIPAQYEHIILTALQYYPELRNTSINFKVKNRITPLSARPVIWRMFFPTCKRKYIVKISGKSIAFLQPIILKNLSYDSQLGVVGHELAHISEFEQKKSLFFVKLLFQQLNTKSMDKFEYNTDMRCINHGLGYPLLSWSKEVREKLKIKSWRTSENSKRERYMNPSTITEHIKNSTIYK